MPLTLSHPVAVLPLRRLGLPMTALVLGSMAPDAPVFARWTAAYVVTHRPVGVVTVDVVLVLVALGCWSVLVRDALVDLAPTYVRARLAPQAPLSPRQWLLAPLAGAVGAASHVAWDAFTHADGWGVRHVPWLRAEHGGIPGYSWAQHGSGAVGLAILGVVAVRHLRSLPVLRVDRPPRVLGGAVLGVVLTGAVLVGLVAAVWAVDDGLNAVAFDGGVASVLALGVGTVLACAAWQVAASRRDGPTRPAGAADAP